MPGESSNADEAPEAPEVPEAPVADKPKPVRYQMEQRVYKNSRYEVRVPIEETAPSRPSRARDERKPISS